MRYFNEKNIKKIVFASSTILVGILSTFFGVLYVVDRYLELEKELPKIEQEFIAQQKEMLDYAVNLQIDQIDFRRKQIKKHLQESLKSRVVEAKAIAENLDLKITGYQTGQEPENLVQQVLRPIRFNQSGTYYFIFSMDGIIQLYPPDPSTEGQKVEHVFRGEKLQVIHDLLDIVRENGEGFLEYDWPRPDGDPGRLYKKISHVAYLKTYDWLLGAGEYYEDFGTITKENIIADIETSMGQNSKDYFFLYQLHDINGGNDFATMLVNPNRADLVGTKLSDNYRGARGREFRKIFLKGLREDGEAYVRYWYKKEGHKEAVQKLSFFKLYPEWNWVVAKGVYLDDLEKKISLRKQKLQTQVKNKLLVFCLLLVLAVTFVMFIAHFFTKGINAIFVEYKEIQKLQKQELKRINKYLHKRANIDNLTGLSNRQHFNEKLMQETLRAGRYKGSLSLVLCDVDHFKLINDNFGHIAGDNVLKELGSLMQSKIRRSDVLARWGGEEFVILVVEADLHTACSLAEKLCKNIADHRFSIGKQVTCSFGVTACIMEEDSSDLLNRADQALYEAKEKGRNRVVSRQ